MILKRDLVGNTCRLMTRTRLTIRSLDHAYFLRSRWVSISKISNFIFADNFVFYKQSGRLQVIKHLIRRPNKKRRYVYLKLYNSGEYTQSIHRNMRVDFILSLYTDHLLAISPPYRIL